MPTILTEVILQHSSLLPGDSDINTFVFDSEDVDPVALATAVETPLANFYNAIPSGGARSVGSYLDSAVSRVSGACTMNHYDIHAHLNGSPHGSPVRIHPWTLTPAGPATRQVPAEVGGVLTLYGSLRASAAVSGPSVSTIPTDDRAQDEGAPATHTGKTRPKQNATGRVYIGPLSVDAMATIGGEVRLSTGGFCDDLAKAAKALRLAILALSVPTTWNVWSRRLALVDAIIGGHVDNAPDIQRRRGVGSSARVLWP